MRSVLAVAVALVLAPTVSEGLELRLHWKVPDDVLALTHGGAIPMRRYPSDAIRSLEGTAAASQLGVFLTVRDETGAIAGIASELESLPGPEAKAPAEVHWTIVLAGRGALYAYCQESLAPELATIMQKIAETGEPWSGEIESRATVGPLENGKCEVRSGTGEFAGMTGTMVEIDGYRTMTPTDMSGIIRLEIELQRNGTNR